MMPIKMIPFYNEYYFISFDGKIYSSRSNCWKELKPVVVYKEKKKWPNLVISLSSSQGYTTFKIHRLVAKAFVPNPENKPEVIHLDGNRFNNHYLNLMWATKGEVLKHTYNLGSRKLNYRRVTTVYRNNELFGEFPSIRAAARACGLNPKTVTSARALKKKVRYGWSFIIEAISKEPAS